MSDVAIARATKIPVVVVTAGELVLRPGTVTIRIDSPASHEHGGAECLVCNTRGNVRVQLFDLLEQVRGSAVPAFTTVLVDARSAADPQAVIDALVPGRLPAFGLRDHEVARRFQLAS